MASLLNFLFYAEFVLYGFLLGVWVPRLLARWRRRRRLREQATRQRQNWARWEKHCEQHAEATKGSTVISPPGLYLVGEDDPPTPEALLELQRNIRNLDGRLS